MIRVARFCNFDSLLKFSQTSTPMLQSHNQAKGKTLDKTTSVHVYSILFYPITLGGRRGTTDEFATIPFHLDLFSAALVELAKSIPVHSLILSSHLFFCLPLFLFPFTVPCRIVFAKPEDLEAWPNHLSFRFLTRVRSSSYSPMAAWIFLRTSSLVTWSLSLHVWERNSTAVLIMKFSIK